MVELTELKKEVFARLLALFDSLAAFIAFLKASFFSHIY